MIFDSAQVPNVTLETVGDLTVERIFVWTREKEQVIRTIDGRIAAIKCRQEVYGNVTLRAGPGFDDQDHFNVTILRDGQEVGNVLGAYLTETKVVPDGGERVIDGGFAANRWEPSRPLAPPPVSEPLAPPPVSEPEALDRQEGMACRCDTCRSACRNKPGWFLPDEVEAAALHLGLDLQGFFNQYLAVDWWQRSEGNIYLLAPGIAGHPTGGMYPSSPTGRCRLLLDNGDCRIHGYHPHECRAYLHGDSKETVQQRHRWTAHEWQDHGAMITRLLGFEPYESEPEGLDLFGSIF